MTVRCKNGHRHAVRLNGCVDVKAAEEVGLKKTPTEPAAVGLCECGEPIVLSDGKRSATLSEFCVRVIDAGLCSGVGIHRMEDHGS